MTTFVAHDQHAPTARAFAWAMRGIGLLGALVVVVLLLTGVLDVDDDRFMVVFMALAVLAMLFVVPGAMGQRAELVAAHPLLQLHPDGFTYGGSDFPASAVVGALRADLGSQGEHSSYEQGEAYYVRFDPERLGYRRRDDLIRTKTRRLVIKPSDFEDPVGMSRALVAHLGSLGITYVDCGRSQQDVERAETELSRR
ncbi:hypothetical protein [Janibacter melonis]|uniref:hypothetical protein n=1 Tax=Janibacter melonis TaxID=262209 RepID=UPI001748F257|nr:hypothetical protein [Janibacter melonis]